jgi:hypothetical protein
MIPSLGWCAVIRDRGFLKHGGVSDPEAEIALSAPSERPLFVESA